MRRVKMWFDAILFYLFDESSYLLWRSAQWLLLPDSQAVQETLLHCLTNERQISCVCLVYLVSKQTGGAS